MNYKKMTTDKLFEMLNELAASTADKLKKMADILLELQGRGESHPLMKDSILKRYAPIASGRLSPYAALTFSTTEIPDIIIGLPILEQDRLANGGKIIVAEHNARGEIVPVDRDVFGPGYGVLKTAIQKGKIRTFNEQKRDIAKRQPEVRRSSSAVEIRADTVTGEIVCGRMRFQPAELNAALKALGYKPIERVQRRIVGGKETHAHL